MKLPAALSIAACINLVLFASVYKFDKTYKRHRHIDKIYLYLSWFDQAQFAGFYVAKDKNFYDDLDLDVTIFPRPRNFDDFTKELANNHQQLPAFATSGPNQWNVPEMVSGSIDSEANEGPKGFGIWTGDQVLRQYYKRTDLEVRAIGVVFDRSLACFMVRDKEEKPIFSPRDFGGRKIGFYEGFDTKLISNWLVRNYPPSSPKPPIPFALHPDEDNIKKLQDSKIDVLPVYAINEPLKVKNFQVRMIYPENYNLSYYSDTLIVNKTTLEVHRDIVLRFLEASEQGWRWAILNQPETVDIIMKSTRDASVDQKEQTKMLSRVASYVSPGSPMMKMDPNTWKSMVNILKQDDPSMTEIRDCGTLCDFKVADDAHNHFHQLSSFGSK